MRAVELLTSLVEVLRSDSRIFGIARTGRPDAVLIPGKSDIDLFVLCSDVPSYEERSALYKVLSVQDFELQMEVCSGGVWGTGDILIIDGIDVMPMYFTVGEMRSYLEEVLDGRHLEKDGRFYPVGRLASISTISVLYEENSTWTELKDMVNQKPESLFNALFDNEVNQILDEEDLGRAELRGEVLFWHQVLENALDHFLQALYALNRVYFPSRKRTLDDISEFEIAPDKCGERLLRMIRLGAESETVPDSVKLLRELTAELKAWR